MSLLLMLCTVRVPRINVWSRSVRKPLDVNSRFALEWAMSGKLMIPRLNASGRASQHSDVDLMLRGRPRIIMLDGGIPPATPLPTKHRGPEALRHCLATVLPRELAYWAREPTAHRPIQTPPHRSLYKRAYGVKIILAAQMRR